MALAAVARAQSVRHAHQTLPRSSNTASARSPASSDAWRSPAAQVAVRQGALRVRPQNLESRRLRNGDGLQAVGDRDLRPRAREVVEKSRPVEPRGPARRIGRRVDQLSDGLQRLDVLGVTAEGELDLGLGDDRVDPAPPIGLGVGHRIQARESGFEGGQRFGVGPSLLRLLAGPDRIVDGLVVLGAPAEMVAKQLHHFVNPARVDLLEPRSRGGVVLAPPPLEQPGVDHVLGQGVLEAVHRFGVSRVGEDEVEAMELAQVLADELGLTVEHPAEQRDPEPSPDDGCRL